MNAHFRRVKEVFLAAAERAAPAERAAYLTETCGDDGPLRREVEALLRQHDQAGSFLEPAPGDPAATAEESVGECPGTLVGPYKLLGQIGEGGFGAVFLAEQMQPVRRQVALKVLKPGMDSRQVIARFEAEQQALALMDHPNIAKVLDAGQTGGGRPYFVMDLVRGLPITDFCDQGRLTPRERLRLFRDVCQAVQHAHQKGIIHRDLKPSNVLVTLENATPLVKVIDFGIAKALGRQLTDKTLFTGFAQMVGTPLYMAPEQATLSNADVDTRSDVYSLGVLLYELLAGTTPFDPERFREAGYDEICRIIREEEPPRPSTRISTLGRAATTVSTRRQTDGKQLSGLLRGELDWIVMKCLEKDRNRRYDTANGLARDIERYLADEPVQACPPSAGYRFRKFARRNKLALLSAALVAGALVLGTLVSTWQWRQARQAERLAQSRLETEMSERRRAVEAERGAERRLHDARLAQAQAGRWSGRAGRRFEGLQALAEAARLARALDLGPEARLTLRNEAIACLALVDLRLDRKWPGYPPGTTLTGIAFDADLERFARVDGDGNITVRRFADNQELARIPVRGAPAASVRPPDWRMTLVFSPDGRLLAASGRDATPLQVWELKGPKCLLEAPAAGGFERRIDFSPDGRVLAARGGPERSLLCLYDVAAGTELRRSSLPGPILCLRFHPRGDRIAVSTGSQVHVVDLAGRPTTAPLSHPRNVPAIAWSADGRLLATACDDRQAYVWDGAGGRNLAAWKVHDYLASVAFNQRGDLLITAGGETTQVWDPGSGRELLSAGGLAGDFGGDDRRLGFGVSGADVGRWEVASGGEYRPLYGHEREAMVRSPDVHRDGRLLASAALDGVRLWDLLAGKMVAALPTGPAVSALFDPSGRFLITSGASGVYRWPIRHGAEPNGARIRFGPPEPIRLGQTMLGHDASLSDDGRTFAVRAGYGGAVVLDLERPDNRPRFLNHPVGWLRLSPDGKWLASSVENGYASQLWDVETGRRVRDFPGMRNAEVGFSPDNRWLVFASAREYLFYRVGSWEPGPRVSRDGAGYQLGPVAFSRDGRTAAIAPSPRVIRLIDPESGREFATLEAPIPDGLKSLCFTPDGDRLLAGTVHGVIQAWDLRRIRDQLRALGLDWDPPADPPRSADDPKPVEVEVDCGTLLDREKYSVILAFFPFHAEAYYQRGLAYRRFQQGREAVRDFSMALALRPGHAEALWQRAQVHGALCEPRQAIADYTRFLALLPPGDRRRAEALLRRAGNYERLNDCARALADLEQLLEGNHELAGELLPGVAQLCNNLAWRLAIGPEKARDAPRALSLARKAVELAPGNWMYENTLGMVYYRRGSYAEAVETLERSLRASNDEAAAFDLFLLAMCHARRGDRAQAGACYDRAVRWVEERQGNLPAAWNQVLTAFRAEAAEAVGADRKKDERSGR
jgi:serine/threonine protein kinase/WD40 repeat protein/tetratricopeptide (TPR) repeat protein